MKILAFDNQFQDDAILCHDVKNTMQICAGVAKQKLLEKFFKNIKFTLEQILFARNRRHIRKLEMRKFREMKRKIALLP